MKTKCYTFIAALLAMHVIAKAQFVREYSMVPKANLMFNCIAKAQNGNYFITGIQDTSIYVCEVKNDGTVVREKLVGLGINNDTRYYRLNAMIVDRDGNMVIVGLVRLSTQSIKAFLLKISPAFNVLLHVTYADADNAELAFTDVKEYWTTGANAVNNAYYVSGYSGALSTPDAVLMRLDRTTGAGLTIFNGQPTAHSTRDSYDALWLDTAQTAAAPPAVIATGGLSTTTEGSIRPWLVKHNISTLVYSKGERYLKDVQSTQPGSLYSASIVKDGNNLLYAWYGNPSVTMGNHTAMGLTKADANSLAPAWQRQYSLSPASAAPFQYNALVKVLSDAGGYVALGKWLDGLQEGGGDIFFIRTDKSGNPVWSRQYKNVYNDQPHNSSFLIDGTNIFAVGYKVVAGVRKGVLIRTPVATGAMDTACALVLTVKVADSTFKKAADLIPLKLTVSMKGNDYPINCVTTVTAKPCDSCITPKNLNANFTLTGTLVNASTTFIIKASAYTNNALLNSQFTVSAVNIPGGTDILGSVTTDGPGGVWGTAATTNFGGYFGSALALGNGVFNQGVAYRVKHYLSTTNNCGVKFTDSASKVIFMCNTCKTPGTKFTIIDESNGPVNTYPAAFVTVGNSGGAARLYPNPANSSVTFNAAGINAPAMVLQIMNGNGQKVSSANFAAKAQLTVNTSGMSNGLYLYQIISNGKTVGQGKFIVQH